MHRNSPPRERSYLGGNGLAGISDQFSFFVEGPHVVLWPDRLYVNEIFTFKGTGFSGVTGAAISPADGVRLLRPFSAGGGLLGFPAGVAHCLVWHS